VRGEILCPTCGHWLTLQQRQAAQDKLRYQRMCSGKMKFADVIAALVGAHEVYKAHRDSMWPYRCEFGRDGHWHLGHHKSQAVLSRLAAEVQVH
jgi:hypothetical protein